jgi:hypothetical protein
VDLAGVEGQLDGELSPPAAERICAADLVAASRALEEVDSPEGGGRAFARDQRLGRVAGGTQSDDVFVSGVRLRVAKEAREKTAIGTKTLPDPLAGERGS